MQFVRKAFKPDGPSGSVVEVATLDYTPITSEKPFDARETSLRPRRLARKTRLYIIITAYNEDGDELHRTLTGVASNLPGLQKAGLHWSEVQVMLVLDGRAKASASMIDYLTSIHLFDPSLLQEVHRGKPTVMHLFERTVELSSNATQREFYLPLPVSLALKEKNGGKLNSHLWTFMAFSHILNPKFVMLLDVGEFSRRERLVTTITPRPILEVIDALHDYLQLSRF